MKTKFSRYRPILLSLSAVSVLNYIIHVVLGFTIIPKFLLDHLVGNFAHDARFASTTASFMAITYLQFLVIGFFLGLLLLRQALSVLGLWSSNVVEYPILLLAAIFGFVCASFFGPLNPDIFFSDDPKLRGAPNWLIMLVMSVLWGLISPFIVALVLDPRTLNNNHSVTYEKRKSRR